MNDLVNRHAVIKAILDYYIADDEEDYHYGYNHGLKKAVNVLRKFPPEEQPERKKGRWLENETSYSDDVPQTCTCSVCGLRSHRPIGNFCKWCGADMRGG